VSANFLTDLDSAVFQLCRQISDRLAEHIHSDDKKKEFRKDYGKLSSQTRDGGAGRGGGKLERDALCTRGRQGKAPFSNRNLRWHPLIVAETKPAFATEIERIEIAGQDECQTLEFVIRDASGGELKFPSAKVHEMPNRFVALPKHWVEHKEILKHWNDTLWTTNSCVIAASESCDWQDAIETYAVLGISLAVSMYGADFDSLFADIKQVIQNQAVDKNTSLPTGDFPSSDNNVSRCPVCLRNVSDNLDDFRTSERVSSWQPSWRKSKQREGDDSSIQIMHINPLVEQISRHNARNARYGHRWCNVSMSDHSLDETLDFMDYVVKAHSRSRD